MTIDLGVDTLKKQREAVMRLALRKAPSGRYGIPHRRWETVFLLPDEGYEHILDWQDWDRGMKAHVGEWTLYLTDIDPKVTEWGWWSEQIAGTLKDAVWTEAGDEDADKDEFFKAMRRQLEWAKNKSIDSIDQQIEAILSPDNVKPEPGDLMAQPHEIRYVDALMADGKAYIRKEKYRRPVAKHTLVSPDGPVKAGETVWSRSMTITGTVPVQTKGLDGSIRTDHIASVVSF